LFVGNAVNLVEHHQCDIDMRRHRFDVAVVDGGVGILLWVEHPNEEVRILHEAVHLKVVGNLGRVVVR